MQNNLTVSIDPQFSVYHLVDRVKRESAVLRSRRAMSLISAEIENATLLDNAENRIFSSFQRMSRFKPQIKRYTQMAANADTVYVFGVPDTTDLPHIPNLYYVPIAPTDQLAKEWFLVSYGPQYYSSLVTEELTDIDDPDHLREFRGLWTFELTMVSILHEWLAGIVGIQPQISQAQDGIHDYPNQVKLMSNTISRLMERVEV